MSEQNVREAEQAADEWTKDNPYRAVVRPAFISGYQAAQAALTSSPSEPLVEVGELMDEEAAALREAFVESVRFMWGDDPQVDYGSWSEEESRFTDLVAQREWLTYVAGHVNGQRAAALITARDAQVAARVREESKERIERLEEALDSVIQSFDAVVDAISRGGEAVVPVEMFMAVNKARAALTANGGGE